MSAPKSGITSGGGAGTGGGRGEFAAIERLRRSLPGPPDGEVWIGDDAAVLAPLPGPLLFTTDLSVEAVHADLDLVGLDTFGWRALAAALSDVAAMGGRADHAVVGVAGPPSTDLDQLYVGIEACARAHGCSVVGGDLSSAPEVVVAVAVTGHVPDGGRPVLRSGARPGDTLAVTGPFGASAAGLRLLQVGRGRPSHDPIVDALVDAYCRPRARLAEGEAAQSAGATALIDVSDGLVADVGHIADASGVGVALDNLPVAPGATRDDALGGGEDYELVMAVAHVESLEDAFGRAGLRPPLVVGVCTGDPTQRTLDGRPMPSTGWEHPWA